MNNKIFSKIKAKYPLAALVILIVAALMGKPILEDNSSEAPVSTTTLTESEATEVSESEEIAAEAVTNYTFRSNEQYINHYEKHGIEMGFDSAEDYLAAANKVISSKDALHKLEAEDNDHIYYLEETNEFVVLSQDGYIRTYFLPSDGIDYFNRQ